MVSCIGFGSGTRFCSIQDEDAAQALLERAFALGINYFDTAGSYTRRPLERLSEKRLGEFSKERRKEIFLATKIDPRDQDGALALCRNQPQISPDRLSRSDSDP